MMLKNYVVLDLETTGLDPKRDKIIEIGALKIKEGKVVDTFKSYVNQGRLIPEKITELTGITDRDLQGAPDYPGIIPGLIEFLGQEVLIGHSILFDYSFLKRAAVNLGIEYNPKTLDTLKIARKYLTELESRSLPFLCSYYQIEYRPHRAYEDAEATSLLYQRLCREFEDKSEVFQPGHLIYQVKKEAPMREHQKIKLRELHQKHHIIPDYDIETLTRNEASRFIDQILAAYGQ